MTNASAHQTETTTLTQATYDRLVAELEDLTTREGSRSPRPLSRPGRWET